jgi:hypothetical protein
VLERCGRVDLLPLVDAVSGALALSMPAYDPTELLSLVGRILVEAKTCVAEKREPRAEVVAEAAALRSMTEEATAAETASLLAGFGDLDDSSLDALALEVTAAAKPKDNLGTLREGLRGTKNTSGRVLMKGELHPGLLTDLMQLFAQNMETGCLVVEGEAGTASVYFREGRIVDAALGSEVGEKAFFLAMGIREGRFSYQKDLDAGEVRIHRSAQHLIMDTLRIIDEAS